MTSDCYFENYVCLKSLTPYYSHFESEFLGHKSLKQEHSVRTRVTKRLFSLWINYYFTGRGRGPK